MTVLDIRLCLAGNEAAIVTRFVAIPLEDSNWCGFLPGPLVRLDAWLLVLFLVGRQADCVTRICTCT